jgi:hypothetical protein
MYALYDAQREVDNAEANASEGWTATVLPNALPNTVRGDCIILGPITGSFSGDDIHVHMVGRGNSNGAGVHQLRARAYKADDDEATNAVQLGSGTSVSPELGQGGRETGMSIFIPTGGPFELDGQFILIQLAWRVVTIATGALNDWNWRSGASFIVLPPRVDYQVQYPVLMRVYRPVETG